MRKIRLHQGVLQAVQSACFQRAPMQGFEHGHILNLYVRQKAAAAARMGRTDRGADECGAQAGAAAPCMRDGQAGAEPQARFRFVDAHGADHRIAIRYRDDRVRVRIDVVLVITEKPLLKAENLPAQRVGSGQMRGRCGKANVEAAGLHRCGAEKGEIISHCGLPVSRLKERMFFSEEKNQKTFVPAPAAISKLSANLNVAPELKVFCFFSSEKKTSLLHAS